MHRRPTIQFRPGLERLEMKQLPSASSLATHVAKVDARLKAPAVQTADSSDSSTASTDISSARTSLPMRFLAYRITNPTDGYRPELGPPFLQVLVQGKQPVPGKVYNILQIAVQNGTSQTFTASSNFTVRMSNQTRAHAYPILTGNQEWKPGQWAIFYTLSDKYYAVNQVRGGFQLDLNNTYSLLVPGPSAIFLRLKYNPATFSKTLNWIVQRGQGAQTGNGPNFGMPDTAINRIVAANTNRIDYGGRF
ncbi:MAG: hypothetical protein ACLQGP_30135 [Isosphaeraceae bacterium]